MSKVSISELERLRAKTLPGNYKRLAAEHNAMPVLLEIVKASKALMDANDSDARGDDYWRPFYDATNALREALAKVEP